MVTAGKAIESDKFHEQYRQALVEDFQAIKEMAHAFGAYATYLSGAGPTVMILVPKERLVPLQKALLSSAFKGEVTPLEVDTAGIVVA